MATTFGNDNSFSNIMNQLKSIQSQGDYDVSMKLPTPKVQSSVRPSTTLSAIAGTGASPWGTGAQTGGQGASTALQRLISAIRKQESGGNYGARNSMSGASGAYQIMPSNINGANSGWDYEALGRDISMSQFMNSPSLQDAIASYKLKQYLNKYGAAGAAVAWYGGPGAVSHMYDKTTQAGGYPSLYDYWNSVLRKMQ